MAALRGLAFFLALWVFVVPFLSGSGIVTEAATPRASPPSSDNDAGSVLLALLESHYSEWMELVERAQMLHTLEQLVGSGDKLTIFAPQNHQLNPQVKLFLLKPSNAHLLKKMVQFHVVSGRVPSSQWRDTSLVSLAGESLALRSEIHYESSIVDGKQWNKKFRKLFVGEAEVVSPDVIGRADGVVHGVDQMLLPMSVEQEFVAFSTRGIATPLPTGAPVVDSRRAALEKKPQQQHKTQQQQKQNYYPLHPQQQLLGHKEVSVESVATTTIIKQPPRSKAPSAPSPFAAPAPGPSLGPSASPYFIPYASLGQTAVETFIQALRRFGGYEEFAGLLVDMTSMGWEISKWVNEGRRLTVLAPDDHAWKNALTPEQLSSPTEIENILRYHVLWEYQTEESLYSTVRRNGKTSFETLRHPLKLSAREIDGQVVFGESEQKGLSGVFDHDIHADGRISVQGVDAVLIPETPKNETKSSTMRSRTRSVLEMLQLPSRASVKARIQRPRRQMEGIAPYAAAGGLLMLTSTAFIIILMRRRSFPTPSLDLLK